MELPANDEVHSSQVGALFLALSPGSPDTPPMVPAAAASAASVVGGAELLFSQVGAISDVEQWEVGADIV